MILQGPLLLRLGTGFSSLASEDGMLCQAVLRVHILSWLSNSRTDARCQYLPIMVVFLSWGHFLKPLVPSALLFQISSLPLLLLQSAQIAHVPVTRAAHANSDPNATDLPLLPSGSLCLSWGRNEKQLLFLALPTLNSECPDYSMGSCNEDVRGG